jgi:UDP-N-acetylmuramate dehydrogenase
MTVKENFSLKSYNTFGIDVSARYLIGVSSELEALAVLKDKKFSSMPLMILGGGSNVLFTKNFDGIVIKNNLAGIEIIKEDDTHVYVKAASGEMWHPFVLWCIEKNFSGIENLSLIPGSIGAGPMQNIGAYGVELKDTFYSLEAIHIKEGAIRTFSSAECKFSYRNSIFKNELRNRYFISRVTLRLNKVPNFNTSYGAVEQELKRMGVTQLTIKAVSDAVSNIRKSKLPDPSVIGNAGSFFKNPEIPKGQYENLKAQHEKLVAYPSANGMMKLAAGWLIEQCGWKGKRIGNTGAHKDQALVLVNYGNAGGNEIYSLALKIQQSVKEKFGVIIEPEVNII